MVNVVVCSDNIRGRSTDQSVVNEVISALKSAGHSASSLGVGPNVCQSYGMTSKAKGKVAVMLIGGVGQVTAGDFYETNYKYDRVIFAAEAWVWSKQDCTAFNKKTNEHDWNGSSAFKSKWGKYTFAQVCEKSNGRLDWCCSKNKSELIKKIVAKVAGGEVGDSSATVTNGYDNSKVLKAAIKLDYTTSASDEMKNLILNFTANSTDDYAHTGITPVLVNNVVKQGMVNVIDLMRADCGDTDEELRFYLHRVSLIKETEEQDYYTTDSSTQDNSSCKLDIYGFGFNNGTLINPLDLSSCGKTISSQISELVNKSGYLVEMDYNRHRKDDIINFKVDNQIEPTFIAQEGDDNNILKFSSISYTPVSNMFNSSIQVFKNKESKYSYTETKDSNSVLRYGQLSTLNSSGDVIGSKEAYYRCIKNDKFEPNQQFSYSIVVPFAQDVVIGDLVQVKSNTKKINTIKKVKSVKYSFNITQIPKIQTELGLDELAPDLLLRKQLREMRESAKTESTLFSSSATKVQDPNVYQWEY